MKTYDVAVIGAGIAGAGIAAELAPHASVLILEAEAQPGYHSTGRSAAFWSEGYGGPKVQPLTTASGGYLAHPPHGFHDGSFLKPRGAIHVARSDEGMAALETLQRQLEGGGVPSEWLDRAALESRLPGLRPGWDNALSEPSCTDIDVAALHGAYLKAARASAAEIVTDSALREARREGGGWTIETRQGSHRAKVLVNAAGAWADDVARRAGEEPLNIRPFRRTIAQIRVDPAAAPELPLVLDALGAFYFKPEAGRLWLSPHDETPCEPCDVAPEELDVAIAINAFQQVVDWRVERVEHSWAGLRSFAPDRVPVYGYGRGNRDFFWCAGQGGSGIQTAPAASKLAASLLLGISPDPLVAAIDPAPYRADRF